MKLVKEILYEKFTEDGDAVQDMGIGIDKIIQDYAKKTAEDRGWGVRTISDNLIVDCLLMDMSPRGWQSDEHVLTDDEFDVHMKMLERLIKRGVDPNNISSLLAIILRIDPVKPRRMEVFKLMLKYGLKLKTLEGYLYATNVPEHAEFLKILVEAGLEQRQEKFKPTWLNNVLKWASEGKNTELIKWSIEKGADTSNRNHYALQRALESNEKELIKILAQALLKEPDFQ